MFRLILSFSLLSSCLSAAEDYEFSGKHFLASFTDCDKTIMADSQSLSQVMERAVNQTGAEILAKKSHFFVPQGLTEVYLLSESHASIHTYPEHGACFVDLFTCGDTCDWRPFFKTLKEHLKCGNASVLLLNRDQTAKAIDDPLLSGQGAS